jgi:hypothetical protein
MTGMNKRRETNKQTMLNAARKRNETINKTAIIDSSSKQWR